jgi:hypothetical protein
MQINMAKTAAVITVVLMMASIMLMTMTVEAQLEHTGGTPAGISGDPNLGPLPAGVTPAYTIVTRAYLSFRPNPIGVGQSLLVNMWSSPGMYHAFYMAGYKVTIQDPDGEEEVVGPLKSYLGDATAWFEYVPQKAGTYKLKFEQPGTYLPAGIYRDRPGSTTNFNNYTLYTSVLYTASATDWQELTVQPGMVASWPPSPLPTDYWTRPANAINREWYPILGGFPWTGAYYYAGGRILYGQSRYQYTGYVQAPNSAHILWKRQDAASGLIGGDAYYYTAYANPGTPSIIYAGRCYQSYTKPGTGKAAVTYWRSYDLRTGQLFWERPLESGETAPTNIELNSPQASTTVAGEIAQMGYSVNLLSISGGYMRKYNPYTGAMSSNTSISPLSSAGIFYNNEWALTVQDLGSTLTTNLRYRLINWTTAGTNTNFTTRIAPRTYDARGYMGTWNISWPRSSLGQVDLDAGYAITASWTSPPGFEWCIGVTMNSTNLFTGANLWDYLTNDTLAESIQGGQSVVDRGRIAFAAHGRHWTCFDGLTGRKLWESEQTAYPWGAWWPYNQASYDFNETTGAIITSTYEGVYAINWEDGKILWHYQDPNSVPFENPYDATPFFTGVTIADGKVYAYNGEHTPSYPLARDWKLHCINATTGELIWKILNPMVPGAVADGYLTAGNPYDGSMYVFGKGTSATTVTAPDVAVPLGTAFTIKGTVLDQSPAQPDTPCVSKESMETQMEYLHLQVPLTGIWHNETISGVPVILTAIGSDGSVTDLGSVTTNGYYGTFSKAWTPPKEDTYTIIASFAADDSYGSSDAATAVTVGPAPVTPPPVEIPTQPDYTMMLYGIMAAVAIAIVLALIAIIAIFRKH